ncbi:MULTISPECIES: competence protein ComK [Bacillaceae]|uniref:Competence protein ComK n=1 Tax=Peribacillus huizhouensis TaxID=1501239 RepID=A0ABR6CJP6_9BACI|nr:MULTISPECIES: competence protein ComK [Bacillaceae]MBA9025240.1 competence protein ComK [Peribacillus huizhouensis]
MTKSKQVLIENYEINPFTCFIKPIVYGSKIYSQAIEKNGEFISPFKPLVIIKKSCEYFGSSYEGRRGGTRRLIGATHKAPIIIDQTNPIFFFPTTSPLIDDCIWIAYHHVIDFKEKDNGMVQVYFHNNITLEVNMSIGSFTNQMQRTAMLESKIIKINKEIGKMAYGLHSLHNNMEASEALRSYSAEKRAKD